MNANALKSAIVPSPYFLLTGGSFTLGGFSKVFIILLTWNATYVSWVDMERSYGKPKLSQGPKCTFRQARS